MVCIAPMITLIWAALHKLISTNTIKKLASKNVRIQKHRKIGIYSKDDGKTRPGIVCRLHPFF